MKKYVKAIFLLIVAIIPLIITTVSIKIEAYEGENALTAYAYELRLVRYEKQGDIPEIVGNRILVYNPAIFGDIKGVSLAGGGDIPGSYEEFYNRSYSGITYINPADNANLAEMVAKDGVQFMETTTFTGSHGIWSGMDTAEALTSSLMFSTFGEMQIPPNVGADMSHDDALATVTDYGTFTCGYDVTYISYHNLPKPNPVSDTTPENFKYYFYYSGEKRGNYFGKDVKILDDNGNEISYGDRMYPDSNLTQYNVENNGYVDTLLRRYGDSIPKIEQYFGYRIDGNEVHKYYVEAVPVNRVLETNISRSLASRPYLAHSYSKSFGKRYTWGEGDWEADTPYCKSGKLGDDNKCHTTVCNCPAGVSCNDSCEYCTQSYRDECSTSCSSGVSYGHCLVSTGWPPRPGSYCRFYGSDNCTSYLRDHPEDSEPRYKLEISDPEKYKFTIVHQIYGTEYDLPSYLMTAQRSGQYKERAVDTCENNKHCVYQENTDICTDEYEYYVGPNKENALVGLESYNPYTLYGCPAAKEATTGRQHLYLSTTIGERCINGVLCCRTEVCNKVAKDYGVESDQYLACAENFCESNVDFDRKGNSRNLKKACLIYYCGYLYGKSPTSNELERQSVNSCVNSSLANKYSSSPLNQSSTCNKSGETSMQNLKGSNAETCVGDSVTDYDLNPTNDTIFERRTYINKVCRDEVGFEYTDTSSINLPVAGTGFSYPIVESGNRNCTYFINLEQWKFDYASIPARDPLNRKRMLYILDMYNQETNTEKKKNNKTSQYYDVAFETAFEGDLQKYGKTNYEAEGFDFSKTEINVNITERLVNKNSSDSHQQNMIILATDKVENGEFAINKNLAAFKTLAAASLKSKVQMSSINEPIKDAVTIVQNGQIIGSFPVERYETSAKGSITYGLEEACMSTDGQSTITKPSSGVCGTDANGKPIYADNVFYTSFSIKPNYKNPISTTATVKSSNSGTTTYYKDLEQCTYKVGNEEGKCWLELEETEDGKLLKSNEVDGNSVKVVLRYNIPQIKIASSITDNGVKTDAEEIIVRRNALRSTDEHILEGKVSYKGSDGNTYEKSCPMTVALEKNGGTCTGVSCTIEKINEKEYEIKVTGNPVKYRYYTSKVEEFDLGKNYTTKISPRVDGRVIVELSEPLGEEDYLHGYIEESNPNCNAHCRYPSGGPDPDTQNCLKLFEPADTENIRVYCDGKNSKGEDNFRVDVNGYNDPDDCFDKCSQPKCPNGCVGDKEIEEWCGNNYQKAGYDAPRTCKNTCMKNCPTPTPSPTPTPTPSPGGGDPEPYLFRAVDVTNPFPDSQESEYPYEKGERMVGSNWRYLSEYITNDNDDETSVTGQNALNNKVEYIIDLTPEDIRKIRNNTASLGANNGNTEQRKRAVYAKLDRVKTGSNTLKAYKSNFLHNSEFTKLFKSNHGSTVSTFNP